MSKYTIDIFDSSIIKKKLKLNSIDGQYNPYIYQVSINIEPTNHLINLHKKLQVE
jgi:hypothetical protein